MRNGRPTRSWQGRERDQRRAETKWGCENFTSTIDADILWPPVAASVLQDLPSGQTVLALHVEQSPAPFLLCLKASGLTYHPGHKMRLSINLLSYDNCFVNIQGAKLYSDTEIFRRAKRARRTFVSGYWFMQISGGLQDSKVPTCCWYPEDIQDIPLTPITVFKRKSQRGSVLSAVIFMIAADRLSSLGDGDEFPPPATSSISPRGISFATEASRHFPHCK